MAPEQESASMRTETIALHAGYQADAPINAVAVPIYQTVAYEFDSAEHAAALFNPGDAKSPAGRCSTSPATAISPGSRSRLWPASAAPPLQ